MYARTLCIIILGFLLGILVIATGNKWILLPVIGLFVLLAGRIKTEKCRFFAYGRLLLCLSGFFLGAYRYKTEQEFLAAYQPMLYDEMRITLQGELEEKEYKNNTYLYYLDDCYLKVGTIAGDKVIACNQIIAEMEKDEVPIGKVLVLEGNVSVFRQAVNEGNFDEASFYQSQKIDFKLKNVVLKKQYGEKDQLRESLYQLRQRLKDVYATCLSEEDRGVIAMMALGDKSLMEQEIKALYQRVGISHVLAISGLHISVIGMAVYKLLRKVFGSFVFSGALAAVVMFAYGCMAGFSPSATRAVLMFFLMLISQMIGRSYDSLSALSLSALLLLWENPFLLCYAGFLFSYSAVLGAVLVGNRILKVFENKNKIRDTIYSGFSIQLMTLPLTAYFYYEIPVYGMFVNFLVLPLMSALLFLGLAGGFFGLAWLDAAKVVLVPCHWILEFYQRLSAMVQELPSAVHITGQPQLWRMIGFYAVLAALVFYVHKKRCARGFFAIGICMLAFVLYQPKEGMELNVLDVGQGDGIYIRTEAGHHLFIDGGSSNVSGVGTYRILPFLKYNGIKEIDYWFVSHADKDHISGLQEILEAGYPVGKLVFSEEVVADEAFGELLILAKRAGTEVLFMSYLDCLHLREARITCIFPYEGFVTEDKNAASLVLYYEESGFEGLFTGDIGAEEEQWIAEHCYEWMALQENVWDKKEKIGIDFYKAAHHGSKYSNSEKFLAILRPKIAVISCSENNRYGHPSVEAVENIKGTGSQIFFTMESGQVNLEIDENEIKVEQYIRKQ